MARKHRPWIGDDFEIGTPKTPEDFRWIREQVGFEEDKWLRKRGWVSTSSTPGSFWVWTKRIGDHTYAVTREFALKLQESLEFGLDLSVD